MRTFLKGIFCSVSIFILITCICLGLVFYGPFNTLKDMWVTTAMTTMSHQYLATWFFSEEEINIIMERNRTIAPGENTDRSLIIASAEASESESGNKGEFKEEVKENGVKEKESSTLEEEKLDNIELVDVSRGKFEGYLLIVNNPARVGVGTTNRLGVWGLQLEKMVEKYEAVGGINAGAFRDPGGHGKGGVPEGILIADNKILTGNEGTEYDLIGFDKNDVLVLGKYTVGEMRSMGIRDAVSFKPFLIVNGKPAEMRGNGGWGLQPRTAIGQTKDGKVLLLVIDGRQVSSVGATLKDVQEIMIEYGAYNAANLDGGSSAALYFEGKLINNPCSMVGGRYLPSAFIIK